MLRRRKTQEERYKFFRFCEGEGCGKKFKPVAGRKSFCLECFSKRKRENRDKRINALKRKFDVRKQRFDMRKQNLGEKMEERKKDGRRKNN